MKSLTNIVGDCEFLTGGLFFFLSISGIFCGFLLNLYISSSRFNKEPASVSAKIGLFIKIKPNTAVYSNGIVFLLYILISKFF